MKSRGVHVVAGRMIGLSGVGVDLGDELLVAAPELAEQPPGFLWSDLHRPTLRTVTQNVEPSDHHVVATWRAAPIHERF